LFMSAGESGPGVTFLASDDLAAMFAHGRQPSSGKASQVVLSVSGNGADPQIRLSDAQGHDRASLSLTNNGPAMAFFDGPGKARMFLALADSHPEMELLQPSTNRKLTFDVAPDSPALRLYGSKSSMAAPLVDLGAEENAGGLSVSDDTGFRAIVGSGHVITSSSIRSTTSSASFLLFGPDGHSIWSAR